MKKSSCNRQGVFCVIVLLIAALAWPGGLFAAAGGTSGPPPGKGRKPVDDGGTKEGSLFGDQWMLIRDLGSEGDGAPVLFQWTWPIAGEEPDFSDPSLATRILAPAGAEGCVQPFSKTAFLYDAAGTPLFPYTWINSYGLAEEVYLIPLDPECNIPDPYAGAWGELAAVVESGRLNLARTTQYVLDAAYEEALLTINSATSIGLDTAGRLLLFSLADGTAEKTVDAPRENLALYQRLMKEGCLSAGTSGVALTEGAIAALQAADLDALVCGNTPEMTAQDLMRAASFLAGAADKFGHIGVDEVIYINSTLGINQVVVQPDGSMIVNDYFDFGTFTYNRAIYSASAARLLQPPAPGTPDVFDASGYPLYFNVVQTSIYNAVFSDDWNGVINFPDLPVVNFTRSADDALAVIYYIHNYELPEIVLPVP